MVDPSYTIGIYGQMDWAVADPAPQDRASRETRVREQGMRK